MVKSEIKGGEQVQMQVMDHAITTIGSKESKQEIKKRKRKVDEVEVEGSEGVANEEKEEGTLREERRQRKEEKRRLKAEKRARKEEKRRRKEEKAAAKEKAELVEVIEHDAVSEDVPDEQVLSKEERRRRRREKRAKKKLAQGVPADVSEIPTAAEAKTSKRGAEELGLPLDNIMATEQYSVVGLEGVEESGRRKKKRKASDAA